MIVLSLIILSFVVIAVLNINYIINNATVFSVIGTLLGAVIGGTFSLLGLV